MKTFRKLNYVFFLIVFTSCVTIFESCTSSSSAANDDPNSASIAGTWSLKSIQCLSVPSDNFPCWKNFLVPLGEINMQSNSTSVLIIADDGTYTGDEIPKIDTLPSSIFACEGNQHSSKQHIGGTYSASEGLIILHLVNYAVNGQKQFDNKEDEVVIDGTYTVTASALTVNLNLPQGERWKVNFVK